MFLLIFSFAVGVIVYERISALYLDLRTLGTNPANVYISIPRSFFYESDKSLQTTPRILPKSHMQVGALFMH